MWFWVVLVYVCLCFSMCACVTECVKQKQNKQLYGRVFGKSVWMSSFLKIGITTAGAHAVCYFNNSQ